VTIGQLYNADNVVVGQAAALFSPAGTAFPAATALNLADPFDLTPWTTADPGWIPCGATDQGWSFTANKSTTDITVEEQSPPVVTTMGSQAISVDGALSEDISITLALALNMTKTVHAPTVTDPGYDELTLTDDVINYAFALIMANNLGYPRVLEIPNVVQLSNSQTAMRRAAAKRMYPASFKSNCATDLIKIINITAPHS
jgi:hypothetical protein